MKNKLSIGTFNVRGIMPCTNYVCDLVKQHCLDILFICEHWLYPDSLSYLNSIDNSLVCFPKADSTLNVFDSIRRGKGGLCVFWNKSVDHMISRMHIDDDRITGISIQLKNSANIFIICVYMPSTDYPIEIYRNYIQSVNDLYDQYSSIGKVILIGDWNAELSGDRYTSRLDAQSMELQAMCDILDLSSLCTSMKCSGPSYSFDPFESGKNRSLIDHVLVQGSSLDLVESCAILNDKPFNTSDHLPIVFSLNVEPIDVPVNDLEVTHINWKKASLSDRNNYAATLAHLLDTRLVESLSDDDYYNILVHSATLASSLTIPQVKFNPHLKPYWHKIKHLHKTMCDNRKVWIINGKPRGENILFRNYKEAKKEFRRQHRLEEEAEERKFFEDIDETAEVDLDYFWRYMRKKRKLAHAIVSELEYNGKVLRQPIDIANAWANYFSDLYEPLENSEFDSAHYDKVRSDLAHFVNDSYGNNCPIMDAPVELQEVIDAAYKFKLGKAGGVDGLTNEHIKYGGYAFMKYICAFFNKLRKSEDMPKNMKEGLMITLLKDSRKPHRDPNNHRGITMMPVIYKMWEGVYLPRLIKWKTVKAITLPDPLQFAYQKNISCLHLSFTLQECIAFHIERGSKVYMCLLDLRKAFDVVWHDGLFYKVFILGINGKFWRFIRNCYKNMTSRVMSDGVSSDVFNVKQSVRQGGVLSPWLYLIFIDGLIKELREAGLGAFIGAIYCGVFLQADDIALLALTPKELQLMIDTCVKYFKMWRSLLNADKSLVVVFGESLQAWKKLSPLRVWKAGNNIIKESRSATHVGVVLSADFSSSERTKLACTKGRGALMSLAGAGVRPKGLNPLTSSNLYKQVVLPGALYGSELWWRYSSTDLVKLEQMHRFCIKVIQDLPRRCRTKMCQSLLGLPDLENFIDRRKLTFIRQLSELPSGCITKEVFLKRLCQYKVGHVNDMKGCIPDISRVLSKYKLNHLNEYHKNATKFPDKRLWKVIGDNAIIKHYNENYKAVTLLDEDYNCFNIIKPMPLSPASHWLSALRIQSSLPIFTNAVKMLCTVKRNFTLLCEFCGVLHTDVVFHRAIVCPATSDIREEFFQCLCDFFPIEISLVLNNMDDEKLLQTLLGACHDELDVLLNDNQYCYFLYLCSLYLFNIRHLVFLDY